MSIQSAIKNQNDQAVEERNRTFQLLKSQVIWSNSIHNHGILSQFFYCSSQLFPQMFPDSKLALEWGSKNKGMRQSKGDYFATHGIGPFLKEELNQSLRKCFFSLNFDESSVNKTSQLDINVSYWNETEGGRISKRNLDTISLEGGTSADELTDEVIGILDKSFIRLENVVSISTDGCKVMLGEENGVHAILQRKMTHLP